MSDQNFIIEEFHFYKVFLYGRNIEGVKTDYGIQLNIPSGKVVMRFSRDYEEPNRYEEKNGKYTFYVYLRADKYMAHIDLLRYEKPLFFYYNLDSNQTYITTSDEPVGEEESSDD